MPEATFKLALFAILLLYAGQPLHPSAPPVPLHRPPPGQLPLGVCSAVTYVAPLTLDEPDWAPFPADLSAALGVPLATILRGRFRFVGLAAFRAFRYKPHALHMVAPCGDLLHSGV